MVDPQPQDPFEVPDGYQGDIGNPMEGEGVQLPFLAPFVRWCYGENQFRQEQGPRYFGGWAMNDVDMGAMINQIGGSAPPPGWVPMEMVGVTSGDTYTAFLCRYIYVAVLGSRSMWDKKKNRGRTHVLGYMAYPEPETKTMIPFGPVVLTGKAYSAKFLKICIGEFNTKTLAPRKQFANSLPISAFYACFGTFGNARIEQEIGQKGTTKKVTPIKLWLPEKNEKIDEAFLRSFFVGKEIAALTANLKTQAREWLDDWKRYQQDDEQEVESGENGGRAAPQADPVSGHMPPVPPEPPMDDEMPY